MATVTRGAAALVTALSLTVGLGACGTTDRVKGSDTDSLFIGLLFAETAVTRWESFDRPLIEQRIMDLCPGCTVEVVNAQNDAAIQQQQVSTMLTKGVDALIINAVDANSVRDSVVLAREDDVPVVAYDRLAEGPVSGYVSFDNVEVGRLQGQSLLAALGYESPETNEIVMMNGSPTDPNAALFKRGALSALEGRVRIGATFDIAGWSPENAFTAMSGAISNLGSDRIDAVYAASDSIAAGVIAALKATTSIKPLPLVTGQDAELAAVQRIVEGDQFSTIYKPYEREALPAAEMALALARGRPIDHIARSTVTNQAGREVPSVLAEPMIVNVHNIAETVVRMGLFTVEEICTPRYEPACKKTELLD
jgi:D-xylose transport system substrate-binding protein